MTAERTDRELLELAAKAAGWKIFWKNGAAYEERETRGAVTFGRGWNPLEDDGDALRLAVKMKMMVTHGPQSVCVVNKLEVFSFEDERCAATRRAIVRAAAAMAEGGEQ